MSDRRDPERLGRYLHDYYDDKLMLVVDRYADGAFMSNAVLYPVLLLAGCGVAALLKILVSA
ncbi:hypothetical protein [Kineobactrum salinum]|uniref:Uncharacterized protein n=1 Tax=Kineobactrum salinum TaxID=2708301 RepID=A0A6C0U748_9GAMM|nr:hypothetical protein [Kineobactrum salinum]QIB67159.1 hypothetical protein G3T16_18880 [Kineobactrum salinum]